MVVCVVCSDGGRGNFYSKGYGGVWYVVVVGVVADTVSGGGCGSCYSKAYGGVRYVVVVGVVADTVRDLVWSCM